LTNLPQSDLNLSGQPRPRLSVIIPVQNGRDFLPLCLKALLESTRPADEVLVVDDGSTDNTVSIAHAHGVRVMELRDKPHGPAYARNRGSVVATGDVLVFIDADVVVHADTLARIESTLMHEPAVQALFGSYDDNPPSPEVVSRFKNLLHHYVHQHGNRKATTFWAGCGAIRKNDFLAAGGFAEYYRRPSIEDIELGLRMHRANASIRLCPEIQATHLKRWTLLGLWRTDIFCRAVPWTRVILSEGHISTDLNLDWRSRMSAATAWLSVALLLASVALLCVGSGQLSAWLGLGASLSLATTTALNAGLHRFFFQHGGLLFAVGAWLLHTAYLLYSSAVFAALLVGRTLRFTVTRRREVPPPLKSTPPLPNCVQT